MVPPSDPPNPAKGGRFTHPALAERATDRHPARVVHKASFPVRVKPRVLSAGFGMVRRPVDYRLLTNIP